ncbi:hypothetical protein FQA39_LY05374 [Lamprigera yunnana]|nr:hypothetical protein FQA39_LY05374 [Lamprigera yunnana]
MFSSGHKERLGNDDDVNETIYGFGESLKDEDLTSYIWSKHYQKYTQIEVLYITCYFVNKLEIILFGYSDILSFMPSSTSDENEVVGETHQYSTASVSSELSDTSTTQDNYEDDTDTTSEEAEEETESADSMNNNDINSERQRKIKSDKDEWIRNKNKRLRMQGKAYL